MSLDLADVPAQLHGAVRAALFAAGVEDGHIAVELVEPEQMKQLNGRYRGVEAPTDVLAFPLDGAGAAPGPRELGDVIICPRHTVDLVEAAVHGALHLCGYDHEADDGEMRALQEQVMASLDNPSTSDRGSERRSLDHPPPSDRGSEGASVSDSSRRSGSRGEGRNS